MVTVERVRDVLDYNPETGELRWKVRKSIRVKCAGGIAGGPNKGGYGVVCLDGERYLSHRLAWFMVYGYWPGNLDHINGNPADNRLCNLRECNQAENLWNAKCGYGRSGMRGVHWQGHGTHRNKPWSARLKVNGKYHHLGRFATKEEAAEVYREKAKALHGDFYRES
jgi:hypothetical protein